MLYVTANLHAEQAPGIKETAMSRCRLVPFLAVAAIIGFSVPQPGLAQTRVPTQSIDPFGPIPGEDSPASQVARRS